MVPYFMITFKDGYGAGEAVMSLVAKVD